VKYLIAYDIADPRRLRRVARLMERHALRCQKPVFWFEGDPAGVAAVLAEALPLLQPDEDVVQAWWLAPGETSHACPRALPCRCCRPAWSSNSATFA
jgi:CRISPR/Cas system-associated endoribonuclease Cas2